MRHRPLAVTECTLEHTEWQALGHGQKLLLTLGEQVVLLLAQPAHPTNGTPQLAMRLGRQVVPMHVVPPRRRRAVDATATLTPARRKREEAVAELQRELQPLRRGKREPRSRYPAALQLRAAKLAARGPGQPALVARALGVHASQVLRWMRKHGAKNDGS